MSHPTGNANVRAAAKGFAKAGILAEFNTAIATFPGSPLDWLGGFSPLSELRRRGFDTVLERVTKTSPLHELVRLTAIKAGLNRLIKHETGLFSVDAVYQDLDRRVARKIKKGRYSKAHSVYAYEDGALRSFQMAKASSLKCLYDLPIGYWRTARKLLELERNVWPDWASTLTGFRDSEAKLARKDEELKLADRIFVASHFTAETLKSFPGQLAPIDVIPYGFPSVTTNGEFTALINRPLKLLFVGGLSQRKGIANLFAAVEAIGPKVELTIVGRKVSNNCPALDHALSKHRWFESLPHHEILQLMKANDVLAFPSLFEGFGLVITEAMSQGTPVITTERTAGPDLIEHGRNGWLVKAGSTVALQTQIEEILSTPSMVVNVGREAKETARNRPWETYGAELAKAVLRQAKVSLQ